MAVLGVVIYTADERPYKEGNYVEMFNEINTSTSVKELTCILHTDKFKEKDALEWRQLISHRLVIVTEKKPKLTEKSEDFVILDPSLDKEEEDYIRAIQCVFRVRDRDFVRRQIEDVPVALLLSFVRANRPNDLELHRSLNDIMFLLPKKYIYALVAYAIKPSGQRVQWPKKRKKDEFPPSPFRSNDLYWTEILDNCPSVRNEVRGGGDELPKGMRKRKESVTEWI